MLRLQIQLFKVDPLSFPAADFVSGRGADPQSLCPGPASADLRCIYITHFYCGAVENRLLSDAISYAMGKGDTLVKSGFISEMFMIGADRITRGILIGGAVGAFSVIFGITESMFFSVGAGMAAGFLAGLTRAMLYKKKK